MANQESIIDIIQKMVQEGQPREKIIQTLHDLGVSDEQSKRLLLIAEADTFTLLKKEINSMVREEIFSQKKGFEDMIHADIKSIEDEEKVKITDLARVQLKSVEEDIVASTKSFEGRVNKVIDESQRSVSLVRVALDSLNSRLAQMELDVEQIKVHKFRKKSMFFSYAMLALGVVTLVVSLGLFLFNFNALDMAQIVTICILILASVVLMFASIIG
jgi:type I site-specific restriction endonuclease